MTKKMLAEFIPVTEMMSPEQEAQDFGKCRVCNKDYQIYHVDGVCHDCHIDDRMKNDPEFRQAIEDRIKAEEELGTGEPEE